MSAEKKTNKESNPNLIYQIFILLLLIGAMNKQLPQILNEFLGYPAALENPEPPLTNDSVGKFPPGFLKDEVRELRPEDVGRYVAVNTLPNIPNDQINMADRKLVEIRKIYTRKTIKGIFQFFEGAEVIPNIDGSFDLGEPQIYLISQILYFLDNTDAKKINK